MTGLFYLISCLSRKCPFKPWVPKRGNFKTHGLHLPEFPRQELWDLKSTGFKVAVIGYPCFKEMFKGIFLTSLVDNLLFYFVYIYMVL